ncbi:MAG: 2-oxo acid dehydrogenase subunit E2 [Proteobacteria bacterium]|nr:2-oxo acid dehydrogenase subunit E2 [Pseudomonadota bacterium]
MSAQPKVLTIPDLGEAAQEGTVTAILVSAGSEIQAGQSLLELETDKVTMEVPAQWGGRILELAIAVGDTITGGTRFATMVTNDGDASLQAPDDALEPSTQSPAEVERGAAVMSVTPAPEHSWRSAVTFSSGTRAESTVAPTSLARRKFPAGPSARREARELGVDLAELGGSGPGKRISRDDVRRHARFKIENAGSTESAHPPLPDLAVFGPVRSEALPRIAQTTARNMARSASVIPHAWIQASADLTALETARREIRQAQPAGEAPLTLGVLIVRAVARQLVVHPRFNAVYDAEHQALVYRQYINVGMAVTSSRGLVVPVLRDPLAYDLRALATQLDELIVGAREQKLPLAAYQGAGFTISNLGSHGVDSLQPLVNWPEVAILGVGALLDTPKGVDGRIAIRRCLSLTLGFDHRVINGADAAEFLGGVRADLENPLRFAL